jgi:hypothetical protein
MRLRALLFATPALIALVLARSACVFADQDTLEPLWQIRADSVEISAIGSESAEFSVLLSATAKHTATLRSLSFDRVTVDGVRIQVQHLDGPIRLREGESVQSLTSLRATVSYRDLESLDPLRRVVSSGHAQVRAIVRGQVQLNIFQQLLLLTNGVWAISEIDQNVPVSIAGGSLTRLSALTVLWAAEPLWVAGRSAAEWRRNQAEIADAARQFAASRLVALETRYQVVSRQGELASIRSDSAGFLIGKRQVLAPAEVVEPWFFNAPIAEAIQAGDIRLVHETVDIRATAVAEPSRSFSLKNHELRVLKTLTGGENAISVVTRRQYRVRFRNSDSNAALLEIRPWNASGDLYEFAEPRTRDWQPAAVMRLYHPATEASLWLTEVRLEDGRFRLRHPVDSAAFGSPVWVDGGIVGLLQDERSAAVGQRIVKRLR